MNHGDRRYVRAGVPQVGLNRKRWVVPLVATAILAQLPAASASSASDHVGLGLVVSTAGGGQIFGWDVNQLGADGVLATSKTTARPSVYKVSVQTSRAALRCSRPHQTAERLAATRRSTPWSTWTPETSRPGTA